MKTDRTKEVIISMLRQPTGRSFLDSGGTPQYDEDGNYTGSLHGYGRAYERNQGRDFEAEPEAMVEFRAHRRRVYDRACEAGETDVPAVDIEFSLSTYHFLVEALDYSEEWDEFYAAWIENETEMAKALDAQRHARFYGPATEPAQQVSEPEATDPTAAATDEPDPTEYLWLSDSLKQALQQKPEDEGIIPYFKRMGLWGADAIVPRDRSDTHYLEDMRDFVEWLRLMGCKVSGIYGDGEPFVENTYNHESSVDQTLQYLYMTVEDVPERWTEEHDLFDTTLVLLQIHNGADVRGGYTSPRAFYDVDNHILMVSDGGIYCADNAEHSWYTDDGYHWYPNLTKDILQERFGPDASWQDEKKLRLDNMPAYEEDDLDLEEEYEAWRVDMGYDKLEPVPEDQPELFGDEEHTEARNRLVTKSIRDYIVEVKQAIPVDSDHNGYCPICGGLLLAAPR